MHRFARWVGQLAAPVSTCADERRLSNDMFSRAFWAPPDDKADVDKKYIQGESRLNAR
jgi:hypothetical protein